jgi:fructose-1,6-bisphosphatase I
VPTTELVTIERFILEQARLHGGAGATGELSDLLYDIALAAKVIAQQVRAAGLLDIFGSAGQINVQGEDQQKLDVIANDTMKQVLGQSGRVAIMVSEEDDAPFPPPPGAKVGKYVLIYDPLDGSSNIDVNVSIGTIFSIHRRMSTEGPGTVADCMQPGRRQVAAGYVIYGPSTMLVYTAGHGVHGFTLDPNIGEFLLQRSDIKMPAKGMYYSVNESNYSKWSAPFRKVADTFSGKSPKGDGKNARYIGSLVADFHRNLLKGGVFLYPGDVKAPDGKLRLLYEASPMAFVAEQAGGAATDGRQPILDIVPQSLHQRTPLVIGSKEDVEFVSRTIGA